MAELVIASSNTQKVLQMRECLKDLMPKATILSLFDFPNYKLPEDDPGKSFSENARLKAEHAATTLQKHSVAEQWGLVIPSLGEKAKALFTSQPKAPMSNSLVSQTKKILSSLQGKSELERAAYLESCIACCSPDGKLKEACARIEGLIADQERGKGSFDLDTIFIKHDYMKTLAELSPSVRLRISARRKALEKLIGFLEALS